MSYTPCGGLRFAPLDSPANAPQERMACGPAAATEIRQSVGKDEFSAAATKPTASAQPATGIRPKPDEALPRTREATHRPSTENAAGACFRSGCPEIALVQ